MTRLRVALLTALLLALGALHPAGAAPKPLLTDPPGDAKVLGSGFDIVSASFSTKGTTKKVGKKTVYKPVYLVTSVTLAGPPSTDKGATVTLTAESSACNHGTFTWYYTPGSVLSDSNLFVSGCGELGPTDSLPLLGNGQGSEFVPDSGAVVSGNTITWRFKLEELAPDIPVGSTFSNISAESDVEEPVFNLFGTSLLAPSGCIDYAETSATYKLA